jgi:hypothetical protein
MFSLFNFSLAFPDLTIYSHWVIKCICNRLSLVLFSAKQRVKRALSFTVLCRVYLVFTFFLN